MNTPTETRQAAYDAKRQARIERLEERAEAAKRNAAQLSERSRATTSGIPFGQPILVGHHSERRHRNAIEKSWNTLGKSVALSRHAEELERRAETVRRDSSIRSDDPSAIEKLRSKLANEEKARDIMKAANVVIRSAPRNEWTQEKHDKLATLGIPDGAGRDGIRGLFAGDSCKRIGFASYVFSNASANIRRIKQRITELESKEGFETCSEFIEGVEIVQSVEDNRVQIIFQGKPNEDTRTELKRHGFKWSPRNGCWQTWLKHWNVREARRIVSEYVGGENG